MKRLALLAVLVASSSASADISRTEVMDRAKAYVYYPWRATAANETASCVAEYDSAFSTGDYVGVAYDWGGFSSLFNFDQKLQEGYGAGSPAFGEVYWCTVGVDCSGFVSRAWQTNQKYATATMHQIAGEIDADDILPGDVFNKASYHVTMHSHFLDNGEPFMYEAVGYNTHVNATGGWSYVSEFLVRRFNSITGTSVATPVGTLNEPILVSSFPYSDSRNTSESLSDLLDGCGAQAGSNESGPEYVYQVAITEPGQLTVSVTDDAGTDIDVHLYESWNTETCVERHDASFTQQVDCGTYYVVADTFGGDANAGNFDLTIDFQASGSTVCGEGPAGFDPSGGLGEECAHPGDPDLPFCNPTLGGDVCLYTTGAEATSFCTTACAVDADCGGLEGGCCEDIGNGEHYCLTAGLCEGGPEDPGEEDPEDPNDPPDDNGNGSMPGGAPGQGDGSSGGCRATGGAGHGGFAALMGLALVGVLRRRRG